MNTKLKYSESLRQYLIARHCAVTHLDIAGWIATLSDAELSEFGNLVRMATHGRPTEDVARFMVTVMPAYDACTPSKKNLERFLTSTYSHIVLERKERLHMRGKFQHRPKGGSACSCCSGHE